MQVLTITAAIRITIGLAWFLLISAMRIGLTQGFLGVAFILFVMPIRCAVLYALKLLCAVFCCILKCFLTLFFAYICSSTAWLYILLALTMAAATRTLCGLARLQVAWTIITRSIWAAVSPQVLFVPVPTPFRCAAGVVSCSASRGCIAPVLHCVFLVLQMAFYTVLI